MKTTHTTYIGQAPHPSAKSQVELWVSLYPVEFHGVEKRIENAALSLSIFQGREGVAILLNKESTALLIADLTSRLSQMADEPDDHQQCGEVLFPPGPLEGLIREGGECPAGYASPSEIAARLAESGRRKL